MVNTRYANAFKEVDYYLKGIREEDIEKIPNKLKEFIKENASESYSVDFDYNPEDSFNKYQSNTHYVSLDYKLLWAKIMFSSLLYAQHLEQCLAHSRRS